MKKPANSVILKINDASFLEIKRTASHVYFVNDMRIDTRRSKFRMSELFDGVRKALFEYYALRNCRLPLINVDKFVCRIMSKNVRMIEDAFLPAVIIPKRPNKIARRISKLGVPQNVEIQDDLKD